MERIGFYGGSFDPPHVGHIRAAEYAKEQLGLDRVFLVPGHAGNRKRQHAYPVDDSHRMKMLQLAADSCPWLQILDLELIQKEPAYTYQTLEQLRREHPNGEFTLLVGSDQCMKLPDWKCAESVLRQASVAVFRRGEKGEDAALREQAALLTTLGAKVALLQNPVTPISSTDVRRLLILGGAREFLPESVYRYILNNGLYGTNRSYRNLTEKELEAVVVSLLKPSRVAHVLGCRDTAVELARIHGANETDAARGALLHDVTKALDGPLQLTLCREYGKIPGDFSKSNPKTLHALTGSLAAARIFGENEAVVSAICSHTTAKADMNVLEAILYVADYMEPNRDFEGVDELRRLAHLDIYKALKMGLNMTLRVLKEQKRQISPESAEALSWLEASGI